MDYNLELMKAKRKRTIIMVLGCLFFPIWLLNIGSGKIIKDLERKARNSKLKGCEVLTIKFDRALLKQLKSQLETGETFYKGQKVVDVEMDMTKLRPKTMDIIVRKCPYGQRVAEESETIYKKQDIIDII